MADKKLEDEMEEMSSMKFDKPPFFKFENLEEILIGTVIVEMHKTKGRERDSYVIALGDTKHNKKGEDNMGTYRLTCGVILQGRVEEEGIIVGDRIGVKYQADGEGGKGTYKEILLKVIKRTPRSQVESQTHNGIGDMRDDDVPF